MTRVLLTGFEPFGGSTFNTSQQLLEEVAALRTNIDTCLLPTSFIRGPRQLLKASTNDYDVILCLGESKQAQGLCLEKIAVNLIDSHMPDNDDYKADDQPIVPSGPSAYFSKLPLKQLAKELEAKGIPATVSLSAGTYVCNSVFYTLEHHLGLAHRRVGFVHVPKTDEPKAIKQLAEGLLHIIERLS